MYFQGVETERFQRGVKLMSTCRLIFETNGLKGMCFQGVETESAFNARGQADVFNLHCLYLDDAHEPVLAPYDRVLLIRDDHRSHLQVVYPVVRHEEVRVLAVVAQATEQQGFKLKAPLSLFRIKC